MIKSGTLVVLNTHCVWHIEKAESEASVVAFHTVTETKKTMKAGQVTLSLVMPSGWEQVHY